MGDYTQFLSQKGNSISPEDENYIQELLEIASSFRTFDAALDEFIVQKGYTGNLADTDAKVRFIKCKFDEAGIPITIRFQSVALQLSFSPIADSAAVII